MSSPSLYWHDYETFGADPRRDRPAQFAGLRTDLDLRPIDQPLVIYCQPARDMLPAPDACMITGITPQKAREAGVPEARFIAAVHGELSRPGTCGLGYNSLRFDDELTRHTLYRNFFDAYEREWRNGNSRWDLIDTVRLTAALRPEGLEWPRDERGRPSFRLERLTEANGIAHAGAHDALADVRATIELARLLKTRQAKLYEFAWNHRGKREALELLRLGELQPVVHVSEKYPAEKACLAVVVALASHPLNRNEIIVFDLSSDPEVLFEEDADSLRQRLFTRQSELSEGLDRIAIKTVHINRCPVLAPIGVLRGADQERLGIDLGLCAAHLERLRSGPPLAEKLAAVYEARSFPDEGPDDPDLMLYRGGFFSAADKCEMGRIQRMAPNELAGYGAQFDDPRLAEMLFRYRARNYPETLSAEESVRWEAFRRRRLTDPAAGGGLVLEDYRNRIAEWESMATSTEQKAILAALRDWDREISS